MTTTTTISPATKSNNGSRSVASPVRPNSPELRTLLDAIAVGASDREARRIAPHEQIRLLAKAGLGRLRIPVAEGGAGASLRELVCGSSLCRAEISYPDLASFQGFVESKLTATEGGVWEGPTFSQLMSEPGSSRGDVIALVYLGRDASAFDPPATSPY